MAETVSALKLSHGGARKGAGRKASGRQRVPLSLSVSLGDAQSLKAQAKDAGLTLSLWIRQKLGLT